MRRWAAVALMALSVSAHAQTLFVERFEAPLTAANWDTTRWLSANGTYLYALTGASSSGDGGITFNKLDAGAMSLISPAFLNHDLGTSLAKGSVRYWFRYRRGSGLLGLSPEQTHQQPMYGTLTEITLFASGPIATASLSCGTPTGPAHSTRSVPLSVDQWHLLESEMENAGSTTGVCSFLVDGQRIETLGPLDWTGSSVRRAFIGFGAVNDQWLGDFDLDDLLILGDRRASVIELLAPNGADAGACTGFAVQFRDAFDGGVLPPPDVSPVFATITAGQVFTDQACATPWPTSGSFFADAGTAIGSFVASAGVVTLRMTSPDLIGASADLTVVAAPGDAGSPAFDAGVITQTTDGGPAVASIYPVGCDCDSGGGLMVMAAIAWLRKRRQFEL